MLDVMSSSVTSCPADYLG